MAKNILILSSTYTGHGHKSITDALCEQLRNYPDVNVNIIDGFTLGGNLGLRFGKLYGSLTRNARELWKLMWDISIRRPHLICEFTELAIREAFLQLVKNIKPDLILSVHPNFNGSVLNILEQYKIKIPFGILIADLISISPLWADVRADFIFCPTEESKLKCLEFGVSQSKLKMSGFPIREKFCLPLNDRSLDLQSGKQLHCLIMSGGEGSGNMSSIAKVLLKNYNCTVSIITGRNRILKNRLEHTLTEKFGNRVNIYGFVENVQDLMHSSDIIFTRGSPNSMLEAVWCNTPLVITGALPGQEEGNPGYAEKYNLGVVCKELYELKPHLDELLANNAEKLNGIMKSQREYRNPYAAKDIVDFLLSIESKS